MEKTTIISVGLIELYLEEKRREFMSYAHIHLYYNDYSVGDPIIRCPYCGEVLVKDKTIYGKSNNYDIQLNCPVKKHIEYPTLFYFSLRITLVNKPPKVKIEYPTHTERANIEIESKCSAESMKEPETIIKEEYMW